MQMKDKSYQMAYNCQISASNQIITAYEITNEPTDTDSLKSIVEKTGKNTGKSLVTVKADAAYFNQDNIEFLASESINAFIPDSLKRDEERKDEQNQTSPYDKKYFIYDANNDQFTCPEGKNIRLKQKVAGGIKQYIGEGCTSCPNKTLCTKGKTRIITINHKLAQMKQEMREKLNSDQGKAIYGERLCEIEPVFANIKYNQKLTTFYCRGKSMASVEFGLTSTAHNLVKIFQGIKKRGINREAVDWNNPMILGTT